jgi:hypothetical protein
MDESDFDHEVLVDDVLEEEDFEAPPPEDQRPGESARPPPLFPPGRLSQS